MQEEVILEILNRCYPKKFDSLEFLRDGGSVSYSVYSGDKRDFLRITKPAYSNTFLSSMDVHIYLQKNNFPVPKIILTNESLPSVSIGEKHEGRFLVLYEFVEGEEVDAQEDAEKIGEFVGVFHRIMKSYNKPLVELDKNYYVDKYVHLLKKMNYPHAEEFEKYGENLWNKAKDLPRGICHGDLYCGNIHKAQNGQMYLLDLDTVCFGFSMYDVVLICNKTNYFEYKEEGYKKTQEVLKRFLKGYLNNNSLSQLEIDSFNVLLAIYHFALQAVIIENNGIHRFNNEFFDKQLNWLYLLQKQSNF